MKPKREMQADHRKGLLLLWLLCVIGLFLGAVSAASAEILAEVDSAYNHITVTEENDIRCMIFGNLNKKPETCIDLRTPDWPVFEYSALMFVGLALKPDNTDIALLGLGGGYLPQVFHLHRPGITLHVVEVDPKVVELARKYFLFQTTDRIRLQIADGRQSLKSAAEKYDQIWIDVFSGDYIPEHMTTREFLEIVRSRLRDGGLVVQNIHNDQKLYYAQVNTFRSVFRQVYLFVGEASRNSIIVASDRELPEPRHFAADGQKLAWRVGPISLVEQMAKYNPVPVIDPTSVLTDDFAPANLYLMEKN